MPVRTSVEYALTVDIRGAPCQADDRGNRDHGKCFISGLIEIMFISNNVHLHTVMEIKFNILEL